MADLQELLAQKQALERQIAAARQTARAQAIAQIRGLMSEAGLSLDDLTVDNAPRRGATAKGTTGKKVAAKYRDPSSGASWSGRGLTPKWLAKELGNGRSPSDFAV